MATLTKDTETQTPRKTLSVFGAKPADAILVPEIPIAVRNNCQSGQWAIGDTDYGAKCSMTILKFSKYFGSLGQTTDTLWGQLWFIAESGELPRGVVLVTYIKGRSFADFNRLVVTVQSTGVEPATGIFTPEFQKHTGQKPDDNGIVKPINYYSLKWNWQPRSDSNWAIIEQAATALEDHANTSRLLDLEGTQNMICLDNLEESQISRLIGSRDHHGVIASSKSIEALPSVEPLKQLHSATEV